MYVSHSHPHLPLSLHAAVDITAGIAMIFAPALLGFGLPAAVVIVVLGMLLTGTGLNLTTRPHEAVISHHAFDRAFVAVAAAAALALALSAPGQTTAVLMLAGVVVLEVLIGTATRYTEGGAD